MSIRSAAVARSTPPDPASGSAIDPLVWVVTPWVRSVAPVSAVLFGVLLAVAVATGGTAFDAWDLPLQRWVEASRTPLLDEAMLVVSRLGSTAVVISGTVLLTLAAARRSNLVAYAVLLAAASRPLVEWTLKELADRPRPALDRMVPGTGPAFPSGHVLAAMALWCLLPAVVALYTHRTQLIRGCVIAGWLIVAAVAASRVYLGVHWATDVAAAMMLGPTQLTLVTAATRTLRDGPRPSPRQMAASTAPPEQDPPVEPIPDHAIQGDPRSWTSQVADTCSPRQL